jgi:micrococcal nuclease
MTLFALLLISELYDYFYGENIFDNEQEAQFLRTIDGDTIEVDINGNKEKIRLLGINTPEKNMPFSNESFIFLNSFVNKKIILISDKEDVDKYNRKLRYVFFENRLINKEILLKGLGNAFMTSGLSLENELLKAEKEAIDKKEGIWTISTEECAKCLSLTSLDYEKETITIKNICSFDCLLEGWFIKDAGRNIIKLDPIKPNKTLSIFSSKDIWGEHDKFFLFDNKGKLVLYKEW